MFKPGSDKKPDLQKLYKPDTTIVHEIEHFPGYFQDSDSKIYDLRPNTGDVIKPSLKTF